MGRKRDRIGLLIDDNTYKNSHYRAGFLDVVALNSQTPLVYNSGSILIGPCWMSRRARASSFLTEMSYGKMLSTRKFRCLFTLDSDSCIIGVELEWCYTLLVSEAIYESSLDSEAIGQRRPL